MKRRLWPPLLAWLILIVVLEGMAALGWLNSALVPAPHEVGRALFEQRDDFLRAFKETALATLVGYGLAGTLGFALAVLFSLNVGLKRAVLPFAIFFQTVPIIAVAPLLVIYFGFGWHTVVVASAVVSIFPVMANTLLGLESTDPGYLELLRVYNASPWTTLWRVRLPAAYPSLYAGLKTAAGLSVIGTVAGEFVAGGGLGAIIDSARTQQRLDLVFGALFLLSMIGLVLIALLRGLHRAINHYRPYGLNLKDG